ncbi:MAG: short-chain dehydrogenase/reductase [Acidimicrobiales bacterium]|nr:short-chain dehydrogenase/reductase [Acidimicrobiales bacterium]
MKEQLRAVVVGASSGLGRSIGMGLARNGCRVAFLARRAERVSEAAEVAGGGAIALACDVLDEMSCGSAVATAATELGGIDALIYCAGVGPLLPLAETDAATWRRVLETNVVGAALVTAAALPHLTASAGSAAYLSSVSASLTPPWPGLGAYAVSKAALDKLVEAWRAEHPAVGFTRVVVGDTAGGDGHSATEFASDWDQARAGDHFPVWLQRGYLNGGLVDIDELVAVVEAVVRSKASIPSVTVTPRPPANR